MWFWAICLAVSRVLISPYPLNVACLAWQLKQFECTIKTKLQNHNNQQQSRKEPGGETIVKTACLDYPYFLLVLYTGVQAIAIVSEG